ncbi:MAG: hypothetical protein KDB03_03260 [Planctomycetales bacterium]|nr:hypothetical protein [Planctomycetales bacterium]
MSKIAWSSYSKDELVEILETFEQLDWHVQRLDGNTRTAKCCTCDISEVDLPVNVRTICQRAARRRNHIGLLFTGQVGRLWSRQIKPSKRA